MTEDAEVLGVFARHYRGRHRPEDALRWSTRPDLPGPSALPPAQQVFLRAADDLDAAGLPDAARALLDAAAEVLEQDRRSATTALERAGRELRADGIALRGAGDAEHPLATAGDAINGSRSRPARRSPPTRPRP